MKENDTNLKSMCIASDGVLFESNFIGQKLLTDLNSELDAFFAASPISMPFGVTTLDFSVSRLISPTRITSTNLLELALSVFFLVIPKEQQRSYLICDVQINSERDNPHPLNFHTDSCKGEIRAQIYLGGGGKNSGGFLYMRDTHLMDLNVDHYLDDSMVERFRDKVVDCSGLPGDLIAFDAAGFHGKHICMSERRSILFTFYPRGKGCPGTIDVNTRCLSRTVLDNIEAFTPDALSEAPSYWPKNFKSQPSSIGRAVIFRGKFLVWSFLIKFKTKA